MKKISTLLFALFAMVVAVNAQSFVLLESGETGLKGVYPTGISPNGTYVVGNVYGDEVSHHIFTWKKEDGIQEWDAANANAAGHGSKANAISDKGRIVGMTADDNYVLPATVVVNNVERQMDLPLITAAFADYTTKEWTILPMTYKKKQVGPAYGYGDEAYAVSEGDWMANIVGASTPGGIEAKRIPTQWGIYPDPTEPIEVSTMKYDESSLQGGALMTTSGNGNYAGGYSGSQPVLWDMTIPAQVDLKAISGGGSINGISNNGKYAAVQANQKAGLYDIENNVFVFTEEDGTDVSNALAVSDNGIVVGHWGGRILQYGTSPKTAFIYTEKRGMIDLDAFLTEAGITYSGTISFESVTGISADGTKIIGYGNKGGQTVGFYIEIPEIEGGAYPARGIKAESNEVGVVNISWIPAREDASLTGYRIYHNESLLYTAGPDETSYVHNISESGEHRYYVKALYGTEESRPTKKVSVILGQKDFPFYEPFNYGEGAYSGGGIGGVWDITTNYLSAEDSWVSGGSGFPKRCALFFPPESGYYEESLTSPYIDGTSSTDLYLSFTLNIYGESPNEKLKVEFFDGEEWSEVVVISAGGYQYNEWKEFNYRMEEAIGKNNLRVRFTCFGEGTSNGVNWNVDNVALSGWDGGVDVEKPLAISATDDSESGHVYVMWADPTGFANLQYTNHSAWTASMVRDDNGAPFIAANMYPAENLSIYEGYKLTSISFMAGHQENAVYKWYVAQDGKRLFEADVVDVKPHPDFTTITLDSPIEIDVTKPLYYGVEAVSYDEYDMPFATADISRVHIVKEVDPAIPLAISLDVARGKANIWSDDNGKTWNELESYTDYEFTDLYGEIEVYPLFHVRATLAKDPEVQPKERLMYYEVYRNGENIITSTFGDEVPAVGITTFIDPNPLPYDEEGCYEVYAYYNNQRKSEPVTVCVKREEPTGLIDVAEKADNIMIYPNSVFRNQVINIDIDSDDLTGASIEVYDISGKLVKDAKVIGKSTPLRMDVSSGVYILRVNGNDMSKALKVVVK